MIAQALALFSGAPALPLAKDLGSFGAARAALWGKVIDTGGNLAANLLTAAVILALTIWLAGWGQKLTRGGLGKLRTRHGPPDPTLTGFIAALVRNAILILGGVAVLQQLGVKTTSIIAALSAASLAVGLAMQGALSNVAAGVMIFMFRLYRVGDIIETGGKTGRVKNLDLFTTELATLDNLKIVVPNSKVFGDVIVDHSAYPKRRADVNFRAPPGSDPALIIAKLRSRLAADPRVMDDPAPIVELTQVTELFREIAVRPWTRVEDYAAVKADVLLWGHMLAADAHAELPAPAANAPEPEAEPQAPRRPRLASRLRR